MGPIKENFFILLKGNWAEVSQVQWIICEDKVCLESASGMLHVFVTSVVWKTAKAPEVSKNHLLITPRTAETSTITWKFQSWLQCWGCGLSAYFCKAFPDPHSQSACSLSRVGAGVGTEWGSFSEENCKYLRRRALPFLVRQAPHCTLPGPLPVFCLTLDSSLSVEGLNAGHT